MNTVRDTVLIKVDPYEKNEKEVEGTGKSLYIPTNYRQYEEDICVQAGTVYATPLRIKDDKPINLAPGDRVYTQHFLMHEENSAEQFGENIFAMRYADCYCRIVDGKIEVLNNWNLLEPVETSLEVNGIVLDVGGKYTTGLARMKYPSKAMIERGVDFDTVVEFKRNAGYLLLVEGIKYYCIDDKHIMMAYGKE